MAGKHRVSTGLDADDYQAFTQLTQRLDVTEAWLARQAIKFFLKESKENSMQLTLDLGINDKK